MNKDYLIKRLASLVVICGLLLPVTADAGLFGAMIGAAVEHHEMEKEKQARQQTLLTDHPVVGAAAGMVAGDAAVSTTGFAVRKAIQHPDLAVGGAIIGIAAVAAEPELAQKARDLYIEARTETLRRNMAKAGEPKPGDGCAAHHIVVNHPALKDGACKVVSWVDQGARR